MKKRWTPLFICTVLLLNLFTMSQLNASPIRDLNFSVWSQYKRIDFDSLSEDQTSAKLEEIFADQLTFVQKHGIRRIIIKILNPSEFPFFHPDNFDSEKTDNFYFWASELANHVEIEALFDSTPFVLIPDSVFSRLTGLYDSFRNQFKQEEKPFGHFENIIEKFEWVAWTNEIYGSVARDMPLIKGITLNPSGAEKDETIYQNLINALDQFRFEPVEDSHTPSWIPANSYYPLRTAMVLSLDQKNLALVNLADFPLTAHIRSGEPGNLGVRLPSNFPSGEPDYLSPNWRAAYQLRSMLDTVYLKMGDNRLLKPIYQNYAVLPNPAIPNIEATKKLSSDLALCFNGVPYIKGPGYISSSKGSSNVKGSYTYFRTGGVHGEGQFVDGQRIEIRPPYVDKPITRSVNGVPHSNKDLRLSSTYGTTFDINDAEYYQTPIPVYWDSPTTSDALRSKLYYLFDVDFSGKKDHYLGNWCYENFMAFIRHEPSQSGFLFQKLFKNLSGEARPPFNNIVLDDYTTIPNGTPFPDCDWGLENQTH